MPERDPFDEIEAVFDQLTQFTEPGAADLPADIVDADDELLVHVDLPGRTTENIDVRLADERTLSVEAGERDDAEGHYLTRERTHASVNRTITLPSPVDEDETAASYDRGVLTVRLQKLTGDGDGTDIPVN